jgi:lysophospholipase L1-like esterase
VAALHAAGLKVAGGTLTPSLAPLGVPPLNSPLYAASGPIALNFGSLATDSTRQQINTYILTSGLFDRTIDFAAAVTDPLTGMLRAPYLPNSQGSAGDYLHPNRAGYQAMGLAAANIMSSMLAN